MTAYNAIDLTGHVYNKLSVIELSRRDKKHKHWRCMCICGKESIVEGSKLRSGHTKTCGCAPRHKNIPDLVGAIFGRWTVIELDTARTPRSHWICRCECGNINTVSSSHLHKGNSLSCGCLRAEIISNIKSTHKMCFSKEHNSWCSMKQRCLNQNSKYFNDYGGRSITIHQEWIDSFKSFYNYVGECPSQKHSIDRINNSGNYEPGNVRWATKTQQTNNTRRNRVLKYNGEERNLCEWSTITGLSRTTISQRIDVYGWSVYDALNAPVGSKRLCI